VAIGRKSSGSPPGLRQQLGKGHSNDWMLAYSVAFFFDAQGRLVEKVGGGVATDGINGDDVWLTPLGTADQWFAMVRRFEKQPPYDCQTEVRVIEPELPTAFVVHHFPNSTAFTGDPSEDGSYFMFFGLPNGTKMPNNASGIGRDGRIYAPKIAWDSTKRVFVGPAQVSYKGQPSFQIDVDRSTRFTATDAGAAEVE